MPGARSAISKIVAIVIVVVVAAAAGVGIYVVNSGGNQSGSGPSIMNLAIVETDPVNQVDSLEPVNITVPHGTTVTLAVQNHDDAERSLQITQFNINQTISSGATERITFTAATPGVFQMYVPPRPAIPAQGLKASPGLTGYLIVT